MDQKPDPSAVSAAAKEMQDRARVCQDLMGGTETMRAAGRMYLPQEPAESAEAWEARLNKTVLLPAFEKAVTSMVGKPFGQEITIGADVPARLKDCMENIDLAGRDFDAFAQDVFQQSLIDSIGWMIADYPRVAVDATLADERAMNVRPYLIHIPLSNVCGWRSTIMNGVHVLTQFRYKECLEVEDGPFGTKKIDRVRVWNRVGSVVSVQVWEQNEKKDWILVSDGPVTIAEIPVITVYVGRTGFMTAKPPLAGLAWLNVEHWQSRSDQRHILHVARVPILFGKMLEKGHDGKLVIGANRAIFTDQPEGDLKWTEITGASIGAGREDLQDIEDAMQRVAGEVVARVSGTKTATESDQESSDGESQLRKWIRTYEDALEEALRIMALWIGEKQGGSVDIAMEWDDQELSSLIMAELRNLNSTGLMSRRTVLWNLEQGGLLPPGVDPEMELAEIDQEGPVGLGPIPPLKPKAPPVPMGPDGQPMPMQQPA